MPFLEKLIQRIDRIDPRRLEGIVKKLARERDFFGKVFDLLLEGILVVDGRGRIVFANRAARRMLSISEDDARGKTLREAVGDGELLGLIETALRGRTAVFSMEAAPRPPDGRRIGVNIIPLEDDAEPRGGAVIMLRDMTAEKMRQARSARLSKMEAFSILAAGIAHEVGNPLNSLDIHLQLLERKIKSLRNRGKSEILDLIAVAKAEIRRLEHIISQFLKAIRPGAREMKETDIAAVIENTLDFMGPEIEEAGVTLEKRFSTAVPPLLIDARQMRQVVINVVQNALHAMPGGGTLTVRTGCESGHAVVSFADTGVGIPEECMDKIFEPYFTTRDEGAGLGLMIAQRIVSEHGGELVVGSMRGRGTTVTIRLPVPVKYRRLLPHGGGRGREERAERR